MFNAYSHQNTYNKSKTFVFAGHGQNQCLPVTKEAGHNSPIVLMYAKPNNANNFKNNYYDRKKNGMVL